MKRISLVFILALQIAPSCFSMEQEQPERNIIGHRVIVSAPLTVSTSLTVDESEFLLEEWAKYQNLDRARSNGGASLNIQLGNRMWKADNNGIEFLLRELLRHRDIVKNQNNGDSDAEAKNRQAAQSASSKSKSSASATETDANATNKANADNTDSFFNRVTNNIKARVDDGVNFVIEYPKSSLLVGSLATIGIFSYKYKKDEKFRKRVHDTYENYYYGILERGFSLKAKWKSWKNKPLKTGHLAFGGLLYGIGSLVIKADNNYQIKDYLKEMSGNLLKLGRDFAKENKETLTYLSYGVVLGGVLIYAYNSLNKPVFKYLDLYNNFTKTLTQQQIDSIGLQTIIEAGDNPEVLDKSSILALFNSNQKKELTKLIEEFNKQKIKISNNY